MGARSVARERALQALYHLEVHDTEVSDALDTAFAAATSEPGAPSGKPDPESRRFAQELVEGAHAHREEIDRLIETHSHNWRLDRMGQIDRNVLRLAIFELKYLSDVPRKVTINEAVELGKRFGTEASSAFINGLLDRIAAELGEGVSAQVTTHEVGFEPLDSLPGLDSLCVFVGEDERPLRGAAGFLDWRLGGALSRVLVSGFFVGTLNDTLLLPTGGRIAIPRVFAIGIGRTQALTEEALAASLRTAAWVLGKAQAGSVALELPGAGVLQDSQRAQALKGSFLPIFTGARVAVLGEKGLGKIL